MINSSVGILSCCACHFYMLVKDGSMTCPLTLRVHQLNKELSITSELIDQVIILASGGYDIGVSGGGGGSDNNDLRWDGVTQDDIERAIYLHAKSKKGLSL